MTDNSVAIAVLLALLEGSNFANAIRRCGRPCRIRLPNERESRAALVDAHLHSAPATLTFHAEGCKPWREKVDAVALSAFCPAADGRCRWVAIDLDGADHGQTGLADPIHSTRAIAERADAAGLTAGLLVTRSRRGRGRHVFLLLPEPTTLADAVMGVAALAAAAFKVTASDVVECGAEHAFRRVDRAIARPGDEGAVELLPRSTVKPPHGWPLTLPGAGAFAARGGGVIVDPFDDRPLQHESVPRCDREAWSRFVAEARASLSKRSPALAPRQTRRFANGTTRSRQPIDRIDSRTQAFLEGHVVEGARNLSAFAASANLLGCGVDVREAERLILAGAAACGLPEREAIAAFKSAEKAHTRKQGCS